MHEVDKYGIGRVMDEVVEYFGDRPLHLSYDIDALDPFYAPHTGTAVRGGLTFREGNYICEVLSKTGRLKSMELVEVNPMLNPMHDPKLTIDMAITLIGSAMGQSIL
jgi:arginase